MIDSLQGILTVKQPHRCVIENDGMGFELMIPFSTFKQLREAGSGARLLCHLVWREDGPQLFGFSSEAERQIFRLLLRVNKVGPKLAVNILSASSPAGLVGMILQEDVVGLTALKGVGAKIASRLVVELKDELMKSGFLTDEGGARPVARRGTIPHEKDLREALENLGYTGREIDKSLRDLAGDLSEDTDLSIMLERVLQYFSK